MELFSGGTCVHPVWGGYSVARDDEAHVGFVQRVDVDNAENATGVGS